MSSYFAATEPDLLQFAASFALQLKPGQIVYLQGDLGAGKTTFVRGALQALGWQGSIKSPTYAIIDSYPFADFTVHHADLYRLNDPEELDYLGFQDYLTSDAIVLIEWPEKGAGELPPADIRVMFTEENQGRRIEVLGV